MLFLTRQQKPGKNLIHIGDNITIRVMRISESQVSIGIEAPTHIKIVRGELTETEPKEGTKP